MSSLWQDMRYGARMLGRNPGLTTVAVLSIALGVSANTTVFSWIYRSLFNPMGAVQRAEEIVTLNTLTASGEFLSSSYPDFRDYRDKAKSLAGVLAFQDRPLNLGNAREARIVWAELVSGNFFDVLGVKPLHGRFFNEEEKAEAPGKQPVAVLSEGVWLSRFGGDPRIIGQTVRVNNNEFTVIGITPSDFRGTAFGLRVDLYVPLMMSRVLMGGDRWLEIRSSRPLHLLARLQPEASLGEARAELQTIARQLAQEYPDSNRDITATLTPIWQAPYGAQSVLRGLLFVLLGITGVVLLIVCANVANLLLTSAIARQREMGVRLALGAGRFRLLRQWLTESLILALAGGALGVFLSMWGVDILRLLIPPTELPVDTMGGVNASAMLFNFALAGLAAVVFGLTPAWQASRWNVHDALKESGRSGTIGRGSHRLRQALVVSEVALAVVTLVGAGLFLRSFQAAKQLNPGFDPENILLVGLNLSFSGHSTEQGREYLDRLQSRIEALPGVQQVSIAEDVPLGFSGGSWETMQIDGYVPRPDENMRIYSNLVGPQYFSTMRIPVLEGREFLKEDGTDRAIVNETFARRYFAGRPAIGRTVRTGRYVLTIAGVVSDIKYHRLGEAPQPYIYFPFHAFYDADTGLGFHIRTAGDPAALMPAVRREMQAIDPSVPVFASTSLREYIGAAYFAPRAGAMMLSGLGALAIFLAALGLYSVLAFWVTQRTQEIGVRMALGAQRADILRMVVRQGMGAAASGIVLGIVLAFAGARAAASVL
ncbi:MAG TPA: ABC transporter permease, partial [Candidatus Acidoferrales bacterium]